ncbi:phosphoribosylanthranilate isomerase [Clostridium sp. DJ247]|uniref:phosphoribosylanthranilate isomerase n=1 Tax=Clostridium sp. DJ247 TaxID=2726188 RepID=UPI00162924F2|nr:phosphoribosylanthranilate isomerase [Clostridium sp. DJ247]MBC2582004.1 phosphoribosylanthranilate isomerase [Clostridium sp. DJ247]
MAKIKICGLKRTEDIEYANKLLPDYVGFVFAKSKRMVTLEQAKELINLLDKSIKTVGVFVNEDIEKVRYIAEQLKLNVIQLHGEEGQEYIENFSDFTVWKSMGISVDTEDLLNEIKENQARIDEVSKCPIEGILLDSSVKGIQGGTGINFNWDIIEKFNINKPLILAGGLNPKNVQQAVKEVKPYAVDVSSGVEVNGIKNFDKMKKFIEEARKII